MEDYPIEIKKETKTLFKEVKIQKIKEAEKTETITPAQSEIKVNDIVLSGIYKKNKRNYNYQMKTMDAIKTPLSK